MRSVLPGRGDLCSEKQDFMFQTWFILTQFSCFVRRILTSSTLVYIVMAVWHFLLWGPGISVQFVLTITCALPVSPRGFIRNTDWGPSSTRSEFNVNIKCKWMSYFTILVSHKANWQAHNKRCNALWASSTNLAFFFFSFFIFFTSWEKNMNYCY